ncbi:MAG: isoleucine--tRNA ligase [Phycisphaerales bacterium]|nr:isoleucine--tRNA ligase [Phycisphaerales bacterium]NNM27627.1 isoleucine--tRNA ligase [Phycisphaerales bacterium]
MPETAADRNYKKTLNLPKTSFPMRANLAQQEPASLKRWTAANLYAEALARREGGEPFVFHDGPPYANGSIHVGHLLNKVLKDLVVRSRLLAGQPCPFTPGWDCHGLPIEHRVMTDLVESGKIKRIAELDDDTRRMAIRKACRSYAEKYVKFQTRQMQRLLTLADYDDPYLTMNPRYERAVLEVFAEMVDQGLVYRALKPVHWSIANQTALAEAELEYEDREDLSVYVDFEADDAGAVAAAFGVELDRTPSFMIWTTTPWTLPANLAIAVNERFRYALVRVDGSETVLAVDRVEAVTKAAGSTSVEVLAEADGASLVGLQYRHPFCDRVSPIVAAEYVTLEDGTGLVHTAPGHGADDYHTGKREGLDIYCPVRDDGTYDATVPEWLRGMSVWDANAAVTEHLRHSGHLFHDHTFVHSYPHDWRSKTPVIFRSTEQWFVAVDAATRRDERSLRSMALDAANDAISFIPQWGQNRFRGMLESRPDWCLSRQRAWGLPIPAFALPDGGVFLTAASVRAVSQAVAERGSDAWFTDPPATLLAGYDPGSDPDAPADLDVTKLTKMYDIFDVWFESGSSWNAVMRERGQGFPVDLYLEGSDQHRGWFQLSLLPALGATGQPPFRSVLTHGFTVDKDGRKMSKSTGNALDVDELLKHHGADVCRWWVSSIAFENDIKMDESFFDTAGETYRKVRNTLRFLLSNLSDFDASTMAVDLATLPAVSLDAWVMDVAGRVQRDVLAAYERYEFRRANQLLYDFCNETLSAVYCAAVKDRLYCDRPDSPRRRATQSVMADLATRLSLLLAPILPHTADEAYRVSVGGDDACVHLEVITPPPAVTADPAWPKVMTMRDESLKALEAAKGRGIENPLDAEVTIPDPDGTFAAFAADFADLLGVSRVRFDAAAETPVVTDLSGEPRCERSWKRDGTVRERGDGGMLSDRDAEAVGTS